MRCQCYGHRSRCWTGRRRVAAGHSSGAIRCLETPQDSDQEKGHADSVFLCWRQQGQGYCPEERSR